MLDPICIFRPGEVSPEASAALADLLTEDVLDMKVVVVSIAGRFRQGKSFLMNFIIKYLRAGGAEDWMERETLNTLEGFEWRHTRNRVTLGVLIWPELFKLRSASGEEILVILMDTQGVFDTETTIKDCTSIFALSVLLSSIQIFNIKQNIQGDDLSHLQLFTEFGRLICSENARKDVNNDWKPFQHLTFLVRDWSYPTEYPFGWDGGQRVLEEELNKSDLEGELETMRVSIKNCFESLKCFLMPYPGEKVDSSPEFQGFLSDIKPAFVEHLRTFVEDLFRPCELEPKRVNGKALTARDFLVFVDLFVREMHSDKIPTPKTLFDATVNAINAAVVETCFELFKTKVAELLADGPHKPAHFGKLYDSILAEVFANFDESTKMGTKKDIKRSLVDLKKRISAATWQFKAINSAAYEKKQLNAHLEQLSETQTQLREEIRELKSSNEESQKKLRRLEEERKKKEEKKREKRIEEAIREGKLPGGWCGTLTEPRIPKPPKLPIPDWLPMLPGSDTFDRFLRF